MGKNPAISVIVAVYNAQACLPYLMDSFLNQTFQDFEVILVDDGSTDGSGKICDEYAAKDSRICVYHKQNGGVSSARQYGIEHARGEYTIHADSDDWVDPTMLEELYAKAKADDADMVICDYYREYKNKTVYVKQKPTQCTPTHVIGDLFRHLHGSCWNKLIKSTCYTVNRIRFPKDINILEDKVFNVQVCYFMKKISYLNRAFYHYNCMSNESLTRQNYTAKIPAILKAYSILETFYNNHQIHNETLLEGLRNFRITTLSAAALYGKEEYSGIDYKSYKYLLPYIRYQNLSLSHRVALYSRILGFNNVVTWMLFLKNKLKAIG